MVSMSVAIRMAVSLAVVLCLLFVMARFARRGRPRTGGPEMDVIGRCTVGAKAAVTVVRLGDRALVIGVTEQSVTLLSESPLAELVAAEAILDDSGRPDLADAAVLDQGPVRRVPLDPTGARRATRPSRLSGSALAPDTWRRTLESVRDLTVRR